MDIKDRIVQIIREKGLTSQQFAEIINVQSSTISHIISERNKPSLNIVANIMDNLPEINPDWLISGNGGMYRGITESSLDNDIYSDDRVTSNENLFSTTTINENYTKDTNVIKSDTTIIPSIPEKECFEDEISAQFIENKLINNCNEIERIVVFYKDKSFEIYNNR